MILWKGHVGLLPFAGKTWDQGGMARSLHVLFYVIVILEYQGAKDTFKVWTRALREYPLYHILSKQVTWLA